MSLPTLEKKIKPVINHYLNFSEAIFRFDVLGLDKSKDYAIIKLFSKNDGPYFDLGIIEKTELLAEKLLVENYTDLEDFHVRMHKYNSFFYENPLKRCYLNHEEVIALENDIKERNINNIYVLKANKLLPFKNLFKKTDLDNISKEERIINVFKNENCLILSNNVQNRYEKDFDFKEEEIAKKCKEALEHLYKNETWIKSNLKIIENILLNIYVKFQIPIKAELIQEIFINMELFKDFKKTFENRIPEKIIENCGLLAKFLILDAFQAFFENPKLDKIKFFYDSFIDEVKDYSYFANHFNQLNKLLYIIKLSLHLKHISKDLPSSINLSKDYVDKIFEFSLEFAKSIFPNFMRIIPKKLAEACLTISILCFGLEKELNLMEVLKLNYDNLPHYTAKVIEDLSKCKRLSWSLKRGYFYFTNEDYLERLKSVYCNELILRFAKTIVFEKRYKLLQNLKIRVQFFENSGLFKTQFNSKAFNEQFKKILRKKI